MKQNKTKVTPCNPELDDEFNSTDKSMNSVLMILRIFQMVRFTLQGIVIVIPLLAFALLKETL
jgi:hypothetical protein